MINKETGSLEHNSHEALYHDNHKGQEGTGETASVTGIEGGGGFPDFL